MKKETGITLIALIITIIVLLILAGVSISMVVGDNGILNQAILAKEATELAREKEAIQYIIVAAVDESGSSNVGTALYDKTLENGSIWNIVVINDTQTVYGTDWYYIEVGTELDDYGETMYEWLVNYETGEIVQLEDDDYTQLDYSSTLAITDDLILNIDSGIIEDSNDDLTTAEQIKYVKSQLGDNITLVGFDEEDWGDSSGITSTSFNFDGVDDYIEIQYDFSENLESIKENGLTMEFYGILKDDGTYYAFDNYNYYSLFNGFWSDRTFTSDGNLGYGYNQDDLIINSASNELTIANSYEEVIYLTYEVGSFSDGTFGTRIYVNSVLTDFIR